MNTTPMRTSVLKSSSLGISDAHSLMTGEKSKSGSKRFMVLPMVSRLRRSYRVTGSGMEDVEELQQSVSDNSR